jgi:hypothetical protein
MGTAGPRGGPASGVKACRPAGGGPGGRCEGLPPAGAIQPQAPATCLVVALRRLNMLVTPIISTIAASSFSS